MKNFYAHIKYKYDINTCMDLKLFSKLKRKLAKMVSRLKFLLKCKDCEITPPHLLHAMINVNSLFTSETVKTQSDEIEHICLYKLLQLEIRQTNITITTIRNNIFHTENRMKTALNNKDFYNFLRKTKHNKKIHNIKSKIYKNFDFSSKQDWFVNKTDIEFPKESAWLLSLGNKFALPITKNNFSTINTIADIEIGIQDIEDEREKDLTRTKFGHTIANFQRNIKNTKEEKTILQIYKNTQNFIKKHNDEIIITTAEKENKTVVIYKNEYIHKMNNLLHDKNTYKNY